MNAAQLLISSQLSARDALRQLDKLGAVAPVLFVEEKGQIIGSLTDGDIRRGLIQHLSIDDAVTRFMFPHFRFFTPSFGFRELAEAKALNIRWVPLLDNQNQLIRFIDTHETQANLPITAVIMAGGRGERLKPLTDTPPKPMLKVGEKPIIEHNLDVIKVSDHVIDLGPDGGRNGGQIIAEGTPEQVAKVKGSFTAKFLKEELNG